MQESKTREFKESVTNTFLKTVSAYANYDGGDIIFGVQDNGTVTGLDTPDADCLAIENKINDTIKPQPDYELTVQTNHTVKLHVYPGKNKPYTYKSKAYRRNDTATIAVDTLELSRLILEGKHIDYEALPATDQALTFDIFSEKAKQEIGIETLDKDVLKTLDLYSDSDGYNHAAELLADTNHYPGIDLAKFGDSVNIIQKRETFEHTCVLKELDQAVDLFRDYYVYEEITDMRRTRKERVPETAFRETVANALLHRAWDVNAQIRILMFDDRIEVTSPGGLVSGISEEEYLNGRVSVLRNPILGHIFFRLHIVEILGTGVLRIREAYRNSATKPIFEVNDQSIVVILPVVDRTDLTVDESKVYEALDPNKPKAMGEIVNAVPFGRSKVSSLLKALARKNLITITGKGRGTKYRR